MSIPETGRSKAEIEAEVRRAAIEGDVPFAGHLTGGVAPPVAAEEGVFTSADLLGDSLNTCQSYEIPGTGKKVWVFPASQYDQRVMITWALQHGKQAKDDDDLTEQLVSNVEQRQIASIYQVIKVCRTGPTLKHPPAFSKADFAALERRLPYTVIRDICQISDGLSGAGEMLGASTRRFFGHIQSFLTTSASVFAGSANCPDGWQDTLTRLGSLASRAQRRGVWDAGMTDELGALE